MVIILRVSLTEDNNLDGLVDKEFEIFLHNLVDVFTSRDDVYSAFESIEFFKRPFIQVVLPEPP